MPVQAAAKVTVAKLRMELGNTSSIKWFDGMGEYVIDWGPGYRIYLAQDGDKLIVLFGGSTKRGQQQDTNRARELLAEYKSRKKAQTAKTNVSKNKRQTNGTDTKLQRNSCSTRAKRCILRAGAAG